MNVKPIHPAVSLPLPLGCLISTLFLPLKWGTKTEGDPLWLREALGYLGREGKREVLWAERTAYIK